jgi:epoxyqueuosine reductase
MISVETIKKEAYNLGIHKIGITGAEDLKEEAQRIKLFLKEGYIPESSGWTEEKIDSFCSPPFLMPQGESIIMTALCYYEEDHYDCPEPAGEIALYTRRNNYKFLRKKMEKLVKFIKKYSEGNFKIFVNGPLAEKPLAVRAGIGYYGKNSIIYTQEYGSRIVLGGIITDIKLPSDKPLEQNCGSCSLCIENCPSGAIIKPYVIDRKKCFQYLCGKIDEIIPENYRKLWGKRLYGCSTCQDICPKNQKVRPVTELSPYGVIGSKIPLIAFMKLSEEDFRKNYRGNQISANFVDFNALRRNALLAITNFNDPKFIHLLNKATHDRCPQVMELALRALNLTSSLF